MNLIYHDVFFYLVISLFYLKWNTAFRKQMSLVQPVYRWFGPLSYFLSMHYKHRVRP